MRWLDMLRRWTEVVLWWWVGRPTSEMRRERKEWEEANPHLPKLGKTYL